MSDWLSAEEATARLRVRRQTLYAYASRGRLRTEVDPHDPRRSLYRASDVAELAQTSARSRKAAQVAARAIAWGEPVLASEITTVHEGCLFYRGRDAVRLSEGMSLESVARLLRGGHGAVLKSAARPPPPIAETMGERAFLVLARRAAQDPPAWGRARLALAIEATTLLDEFADAATGETAPGLIHERLAAAWGRPASADTIRRVLVLTADHELNASTFAVRVAASTGASLAAACLAGLAALSGPLHGGAPDRVAELVAEASRLGPGAAIDGRLARGEPIPGFGHPLYPEGDPRAAAMLLGIEASHELGAVRAAAEGATGLSANVDFALVAIAQALRLPGDAPFALFAVARCAGWIAHALEQSSTGRLIRPRARYVGETPEGSAS